MQTPKQIEQDATDAASIQSGAGSLVSARLLVSALLAEYQALKTEQTYRITVRDTSLVLTLTFVVGAFATYLQASPPNREYLALLVPFATAAAFWVYISNDVFVTGMRKYLSGNLSPRIVSAMKTTGADQEKFLLVENQLFAWEQWHQANMPNRQIRKLARVAIVMIIFGGAALLGLGLSATSIFTTGGSLSLQSLWLAGLATTLVTLAVNFGSVDL